MASKTAKQRSGLSLGFLIFLIVAVVILLTVGSAITVSWVQGERFARQNLVRDLSGGHTVHVALQQQRYRQLLLIKRLFETDQILTSYLVEAAQGRDPDAVLDFVNEYQNLLRFDLAVVLDQDGKTLGRTDDPGRVGEDLSSSSLVAVALAENDALGVWQEGGGLYDAVAVPLKRQFDLVGYIVVAFAVNDALALQVQRSSGAEAAYLSNAATGPEVAASTIDPALREELILALRRRGEVLQRVTQRGETQDRLDLELQGRPYLAFLAPLRGAGGQPVGAVVALTSMAEARAASLQLVAVLAGLGALGLAAALVLAQVVGRRSWRPVALLAAAAEEAAGGNLEVSLPRGAGDVGRLSDALERILHTMREKLALEFLAGRLARFLPEPARGGALERPAAREATLVAVEMRRFADAKIGYDPEENLGRFGRDLKRIASVVEARQGRLEAVYGHRALALFEGETAAAAGLAAATEILVALSERESVFDEPNPPVVALTSGTVVTGTVAWGDQPGAAVAGLPVQQLESLVREATPGELYLSKQILTQLAPIFQQAGAQVRSQRGLVSPQPLYVLSAELAAQLTGVSLETPAAAGFPEERRSLSDVKPGLTLGQRFEILAELEAGQMGPVFKARDRELGDLVTLRMLRPEIVANAQLFEWLRAVIQRARAIRHPNVLAVYDFGEADGLPYISGQFERGMSLRYLLAQGGQIPIQAGLRLARQMVYGLAAVHGERLLHRGLRPENVLVEAGGNVRLAEVGLTLPPRSGSAGADAAYLAPEQLQGGEADSRADIYSLGAVLFETFTGQAVSAGAAAPSTLCEMPPALEQVIVRCLAASPEQRYATVGEVQQDLEAIRV